MGGHRAKGRATQATPRAPGLYGLHQGQVFHFLKPLGSNPATGRTSRGRGSSRMSLWVSGARGIPWAPAPSKGKQKIGVVFCGK
ncbi:hypothetical protein BDM02DRAFT_3124708 [Thelephora ganbajun]|uniref:Uncharacterized protein n=1 Tax=Thelephora ganbajun TaxID=370292 RepID=A0ACB6YZI6_THEGA|nr:hypothetical protein BDM02DRAFT_3124708 [Thelephora ganbajun]